MPAVKNASVKPRFFATPGKFRAWLEKNHDKAEELWVGFYKRDSGRPSITWPESVDEALCFGWIDGVRYAIDEASYMIRFSPRRAGSTWSAVNIDRAEELKRQGRMHPAGLKAYAERDEEKSRQYSYERKHAALAPAEEQEFRANKAAWDYFQAQPASYRKAAIWWVISAKRAETRRRHLETLVSDSARGRPVAPLSRMRGTKT